jgi:hypothetical protein
MAGNFNTRYSRTVVTPGLCWGRLSLDGELAIAIITFGIDPISVFQGTANFRLNLSEPQHEFYKYDVQALPGVITSIDKKASQIETRYNKGISMLPRLF